MSSTVTRRAVVAASLLAAARPARAQAAIPAGPVRIGVLTDEAGPYASSGGAGSIFAARMAAAEFGPTVLGATDRDHPRRHPEQTR